MFRDNARPASKRVELQHIRRSHGDVLPSNRAVGERRVEALSSDPHRIDEHLGRRPFEPMPTEHGIRTVERRIRIEFRRGSGMQFVRASAARVAIQPTEAICGRQEPRRIDRARVLRRLSDESAVRNPVVSTIKDYRGRSARLPAQF